MLGEAVTRELEKRVRKSLTDVHAEASQSRVDGLVAFYEDKLASYLADLAMKLGDDSDPLGLRKGG